MAISQRLNLLGILTLFLSLLLSSCSEKYSSSDPAKFNEAISARTDFETVQDLLLVYYDYPENEGVPNLTLESSDLGAGVFRGTLIHDHMQDDSQRALKIVMEAKKEEGHWRVISIREARKCYPSRGHTNWGTQWCS